MILPWFALFGFRLVRFGSVRFSCLVSVGLGRLGLAGFGVAWRGLAWLGLARFRFVWFCMFCYNNVEGFPAHCFIAVRYDGHFHPRWLRGVVRL